MTVSVSQTGFHAVISWVKLGRVGSGQMTADWLHNVSLTGQAANRDGKEPQISGSVRFDSCTLFTFASWFLPGSGTFPPLAANQFPSR